MSWRDKGKVCSGTELAAFRNEWLNLKSQLNRSQSAVVALAQFESDHLGYCKSCVRVIPSSRQYCPFCRKEAANDV